MSRIPAHWVRLSFALELLVHTEVTLVPPDLVACEIDVPETLDVERVKLADLPGEWRFPGHPGCCAIGDRWLAAGRTPVLRVPSAVVHEEWNYIINQRHRAAKAIEIVRRRKFSFDARLLG